jgi:hypothetical protein
MEVARIERFAVLASSIACRQLTVRMTDTDVTHTDGRTIYTAGATQDVVRHCPWATI